MVTSNATEERNCRGLHINYSTCGGATRVSPLQVHAMHETFLVYRTNTVDSTKRADRGDTSEGRDG
ncbi:hypothetical protein CCHR01_07004 [Colletotrichum chrysophilum]|uniref:Uncharacterized protein n=1 Tax=Colletotrichum chrysophilum TaxID=1836956 RepID=A0AAD9EG99_9PEZI|nr:hypothetical protein CCHR01_07004 [Colletotrichum chrysophilum]